MKHIINPANRGRECRTELIQYKNLVINSAYLLCRPRNILKKPQNTTYRIDVKWYGHRDISGKWTWWAIGPSSPKNMGRGYGGRLRPPLGPGQRPGRGFRGAKPPEKIWVFRHFKGNFLLNSDTYFSPNMARNTLRKILEFFLFSWSLRFYLFFKLE